MKLPLILAQVSGNALLNGLVWLVVVGLICYLLWWLIGYMGLPAPFDKVARCVLALVAVVLLINWLLGLSGHGIVVWHQ